MAGPPHSFHSTTTLHWQQLNDKANAPPATRSIAAAAECVTCKRFLKPVCSVACLNRRFTTDEKKPVGCCVTLDSVAVLCSRNPWKDTRGKRNEDIARFSRKLVRSSFPQGDDPLVFSKWTAAGRHQKEWGKRTTVGGTPAIAMIREVVAAGTAAATVSTNGGHAVVLRVALATVTQVAVTAAAVVYGAYLSPYADGILRRGTTKDETPSMLVFDGVDVTDYKIFQKVEVQKAIAYAREAHTGQMRKTGEPYITHCVHTARILAALVPAHGKRAVNTVVAGVLHDVVDDTGRDLRDVREHFGDEVARLVAGVSKLSHINQLLRRHRRIAAEGNPDEDDGLSPAEVDSLRMMLLGMVNDPRVVLIKLADRLHNMRTLGALSFRKQLQIANETLEIFAPLANRLGIWSWKAELEDLCFKHLKPEEYKELATRLSGCCREGIVMSSIHQLYEALQSQGVQFTDLSGRPKNLYSIYKKMMTKGRTVEEIFDVRGLRLIVVDEKSCYDALRIVHELWLHIPGQSKDYIVMPKPNGYQSLHTVVWGDDGYPLEVQIRTVAMHHQAEFGLAAHWRYKEDDSIHSSFILARVEWARWVLTWHSEILDTKLRLSPLRADLKPPCPFPVHTSGCPYASMCCGPQLSGTEPLLIIKVENENMVIQELPPGSTVADLMSTRKSDIESLAVSSRRPSRKEARVKVNHQFVDTFQQKLRMGDLVEVTMVVVTSQPSPVHTSSGQEQPCGKIALEFQREQLKRLYLDGGDCSGEMRRSTPLERSPSVAGLT